MARRRAAALMMLFTATTPSVIDFGLTMNWAAWAVPWSMFLSLALQEPILRMTGIVAF